MFDHNDDDDDTPVVELHMEFELGEDEDGDVVAQSCAIHSHVHGVPPNIAAETLLIVIHKMVAESMAHTVFEGVGNKELAHAMGRASAAAYLIEAIKHLPEAETETVSLHVPDDASELLGE